MEWLRRLFRRRASREELLREGLALAMDWGDDWLSPINTRLHERHRYLGADELAIINDECQAAMRWGHEIMHDQLRDGARSVDAEGFAHLIHERHPWVDEETMARLLKQSIYYAAKTGGYERDARASG